MAQFSTPCLGLAQFETPIQTSRADTEAESLNYDQVSSHIERQFKIVHKYIDNLAPAFEFDNDSIGSESSIFNGCITWCVDTTIVVDMAADMIYRPQGNQGLSEVFSTNASIVTDWADEQSSYAPAASVASSNQHIQNPTGNCKSQKLTSIVYDIPTLLRLRNEIDGKRLELRVNPAALAENVFKDSTNARLTHERNMLSRGLSSFPHRSTDSDEELMFQGRLVHHPSRQPRAPPETPHAQQNEGFVRFLKQYASPPHHRVTAGGRIVPAGPLSPPPMLTLNSIDSRIGRHPGDTEPYRNKDRTRLASSRAATINTDETLAEQTRVGNARLQNSITSFQNQGADDNGHGAGPATTQISATGTYAVQTTTPRVQFPSGPVAMTMLQDGSMIYSSNGLMYRSYWNGTETVMEPLSVSSSTPALQDYSLMGNSQPWFGAQSALNPTTILGNAASTTQSHNSLLNQDPRAPALNNHFDNLRLRLTALDKHMALHLHELPSTVHAGLVAQRKELVEQLDNLRVAREQVERYGSTSTPVFSPYAMANMNDYQHNFGPQTTTTNVANPEIAVPPSFVTPRFTPATVSREGVSDEVESAMNNGRGVGTSKGLSPNAPAFVPSFAQRKSSTIGNSQHDGIEQHGHPSHASINSGDILTPQGSCPVGASSSNNLETKEASYQSTQQVYPKEKTLTRRFEAASDTRSSSQDMLPLVSVQEAEYVDRLGLNPAKGPKLYCSIPAEFQEVIRRAREQATLYGCFGGQSKDPAYDAEQDIRWAMLDFEPILVAKQTPDHFTKPRPWNWNDSAYNYRVVRYTSGRSENVTDQKVVHLDVGNVEPESKFPVMAPKESGNDLRLHRHVNSWEDYDPNKYSNAVKLAEATPSQFAECNGLEDTVGSRGPLSATSGNSHCSKKAKGDHTLKAESALSKPKKASDSFIEEKALVDVDEKSDSTTAAERQPEPPHRHRYHAYVESYDGSPSTPRTKFTLHLVPAEAVIDNNTDSDQGLSEDSAPRDAHNSWGPVTESKDCWGPDYEEDGLSIGSWGKPDQGGKQEPARAGEKGPRITPTVRLPASLGDLLTEPHRIPRSNSSVYENSAAETSDDVFNASNTPVLAFAEAKKKQPGFGTNKSMESSSTTSTKSKHEFLRGMLDSTLHSSTRNNISRVKHARYVPASEREQHSFNSDADGWEETATNKENIWSEGQINNDRSGHRLSTIAGVAAAGSVYFGQNARAIKAPSSLAPSKYHAKAYMPQYDRAGNQLASMAYRGYMPQHQGTNAGSFTRQNPSHVGPQHQHTIADSANYSDHNSRHGQKSGQETSAGHYGEEYLNSF